MRLALTGICVGLVALMAGCGGSEDSGRGGSDADQIRAVVERFNAAGEALDPEILCSDVLPPSSLEGQSVEECAQSIGPAMKKAPENWEPITDVTHIDVHGDTASATISKGARSFGGADFVREDGSWYMRVFD